MPDYDSIYAIGRWAGGGWWVVVGELISTPVTPVFEYMLANGKLETNWGSSSSGSCFGSCAGCVWIEFTNCYYYFVFFSFRHTMQLFQDLAKIFHDDNNFEAWREILMKVHSSEGLSISNTIKYYHSYVSCYVV